MDRSGYLTVIVTTITFN